MKFSKMDRELLGHLFADILGRIVGWFMWAL